ncbi:MAG: hypothetical protein FWE03_00495 [Firmicutes bacterium]|nr:hypothetical protein [Bacillota bacterium]
MKELKNFKKKEHTIEESDKNIVKDYIGKYDGFSEDQLINALAMSVKNAKEDGSYSDEQMKSFIELVSPQLNDEQRKKLGNLVKLIEEDEI